MAKNEYVCLDCGRQFVLSTSFIKKTEERCPYCEGKRLMKINPSSWYGFFDGGG